MCIVTDERPKTREKQARGVGVHGDGAKGMNEHALWADLEEVVEVKEAVLVGATSIKPELRRHTDSRFSSFAPAHFRAHVVCTYNRVQFVRILKITGATLSGEVTQLELSPRGLETVSRRRIRDVCDVRYSSIFFRITQREGRRDAFPPTPRRRAAKTIGLPKGSLTRS